MNRKSVVSFLVMISLVISVFGTAFADSSNNFKSYGDYYKWNFTSSSGLLTIETLYTYDIGNGTDYSSVASSVKAMTIKNIHYSYDGRAPYDFYGIISGLDNLKTITVSSTCSGLHNLVNCPALQKITFNNNKAKHTDLDFYRSKAKSIPAITYDNNNTSNYFVNFKEYTGNSSITVPAGYGSDSHITYSFASSSVKSVSFASGTKTIPEYAFENCKSLSSVTIPSGVTTIGNGAFCGCGKLTSISIPASVTAIRYDAFCNTGLATVNYSGSRDQWFGLIKMLDSDGGTVSGSSVLYVNDTTIHCSDGDIIIKVKEASDHYDYIQYPVGWYKKDSKWYYYYQDGTMPRNCIKEINGTSFHFDSNGAMTTGWFQNNGKKYYFDKSCGAMLKNCWKSDSGNWFYLGSDGAAVTGWKTINNTRYYFNKQGEMADDWEQIDGAWYYFNKSGLMQTGWQEINNFWYYFEGSGAMVTGWKDLGIAWYYFNEKGILQTEWQKIGDFWYYLGTNGAMVTGWQKINGSWYYFNNYGMMATGYVTIDGKTYHFNEKGVWIP